MCDIKGLIGHFLVVKVAFSRLLFKNKESEFATVTRMQTLIHESSLLIACDILHVLRLAGL